MSSAKTSKKLTKQEFIDLLMGLDKAISTDLSAAEKFNLTIEISKKESEREERG